MKQFLDSFHQESVKKTAGVEKVWADISMIAADCLVTNFLALLVTKAFKRAVLNDGTFLLSSESATDRTYTIFSL